MADTKTYLYSVNPRKTITGLTNVASFRSPKSLFLTLDDVKICLEKATVYRRFANENKFEKVTIGNYERLHNDKFMTEKEYEQFKINQLSKDSSTVSAPKVTSASTENIEEKKTENLKVESVPENKKETVEATSENKVNSEEIYESDEDEVIEKEFTEE